ncbi:hypothetical protein SDC9_136841 [bioreactor metagenome]|uniref:Uncharacterized protein n=1 Tax=bioreactor metagenome TaxID=1076179 RepID=A0A645DK93_9ZZZZ
MKSYIYLKSMPDNELRTLYKQAKEYDIKQPKDQNQDIPSENYPELRNFVLKSYYVENNEKFCSPIARTNLLMTIQDEIINRFLGTK